MLTQEPNEEMMRAAIEEAGGLFYQYRPCRRDLTTIYDVENIKHGVVYAQTPLNMNDPFDSQVGFSAEKLFDEAISSLTESIEDKTTRIMLSVLLKYRLFGSIAQLLTYLNELKKYILLRRAVAHKQTEPTERFIIKNMDSLYKKCPKSLKQAFSKDAFEALSLVLFIIKEDIITEENLQNTLRLDEAVNNFYQAFLDIQNKQYLPTLRSFLEKITVCCFSASGWNNQLMWSHYANSYGGICIEYDFRKISNFIGFFLPVDYVCERPTMSLEDLGIAGVDLNSEEKIQTCECDAKAILSYICSKNTCWSYEKEWRIVNIGDPNTPLLINLPFINSITFGVKMDPICRRLLWDVCKENEIPCYQLELSKEDFSIDRRPLEESDFEFNPEAEQEYIEMLSQQFIDLSNRLTKHLGKTKEGLTKSFCEAQYDLIIDMLSDWYYIKEALKRVFKNQPEAVSNPTLMEEMDSAKSSISDLIMQIKETILICSQGVWNYDRVLKEKERRITYLIKEIENKQ